MVIPGRGFLLLSGTLAHHQVHLPGFLTHSCHAPIQQSASNHPQVRQCEKRVQLLGVLG